jgi:hypothetical protein
MSFQDRSIQCSDCGAIFTFSAEEQEVFQSKDYTTTPNAVPRAVKLGSQNDTEMIATAAVPTAKCFRQRAPSVAEIPKCHLSHDKVGQYIAANATAKLELIDTSSKLRRYIGRESRPIYLPD